MQTLTFVFVFFCEVDIYKNLALLRIHVAENAAINDISWLSRRFLGGLAARVASSTNALL